MTGMNSHLEMGSLNGSSGFEFQEESLVSPATASRTAARKVASLDSSPNISFPTAGPENCDSQCLWNSTLRSIKVVFFSDKINLLVPLGPLAVLVHKLTNHHGWVFFLSLVGIIPLAERLGWATEQLACYTGATVDLQGSFGSSFGNGMGIFGHEFFFLGTLNYIAILVGGLLNATFGNATELIISMHAMRSGMLRVVQQSLLGSILSNMLLVLGCAFLFGGMAHPNKEQVFDKTTAVMNSGLLLMSVMGLLFPAVLHFTHTELHFGKSELALSRFSSCVMLVAYGAYIFFQLTSHKNSYTPINEEGTHTDASSDDEEAPDISKWESIVWLSVLTAWISVLSEYLVNAIEGASAAMDIPVAFISVILLPIVGNAAEHAGAIMFAVKDKLDISLGVAIGSSTQIAMFGIPFCVVVGWIMGRPMDLNFQLFETATLFVNVIVVAFMLQEGTANYFKGLMLIFCYMIVAASFFVHIDPKSIRDNP